VVVIVSRNSFALGSKIGTICNIRSVISAPLTKWITTVTHCPLAMSDTSSQIRLKTPAFVISLDNAFHILLAIIEIILSWVSDDLYETLPFLQLWAIFGKEMYQIEKISTVAECM